MKGLKKISCILSMLLILVGITIQPVKAEELYGDCTVYFTIKSLVDDYEGIVYIKFDNGEVSKELPFSKMYWDCGEFFPFDFFGPVEVTITLEDDSYTVVDMETLKPVTSLEFKHGETINMNLLIVSADAEYQDLIALIGEGGSYLQDYLDTKPDTYTETNNVIKEGFQENAEGANEVFDAFVEATYKVFDAPEWKLYFKSTGYSGGSVVYPQFVHDGKKEDFEKMTDFEQYVYYVSYLRFASFVTEPYKMSEEEYMDTGDAGFEKFCEKHFHYVNDDMDQEVRAAITDMLRWQFAFYREHNYPYNFVNKRSYLEETGSGVQEEYSEENAMEEILSELTKEEKKEMDQEVSDLEEEQEEERGIWAGVLDKIKTHTFTLVMLVVLTVAWLIVRRKVRQMNIDEMTKSGK